MRQTYEHRRLGDDAGQVTPLMAAFLVFVGVAMLFIVGATELVVDRTRAQTAADAAALAGVIDGRDAAVELAQVNGGELIAFDVRNGDVQVTVRVGSMRATATARADPPPSPVGRSFVRTSPERTP